MKKNSEDVERVIRISAGLLILSLALAEPQTLGLIPASSFL